MQEALNKEGDRPLQNQTKLRSLCDLMLFLFLRSGMSLFLTLTNLATSNDAKANCFVAVIERFDFIVFLVVAGKILQYTQPLAFFLQNLDTELLEAKQEAENVIETL